MSRAVFLDRDGTIIEYLPYLYRTEDVALIPGVDRALRILQQHGFKLIVITNQAGVAYGYFDEDAVHRVHRRMIRQLEDRGCYLDGIYYCPHHPQGSLTRYKRVCSCRKPETGLLKKAAKEHDLDLRQCFMVGDTVSDVSTGQRSGGTGCLVLTGIGRESFKLGTGIKPAFPSLFAAARWIIKRRGSFS